MPEVINIFKFEIGRGRPLSRAIAVSYPSGSTEQYRIPVDDQKVFAEQ